MLSAHMNVKESVNGTETFSADGKKSEGDWMPMRFGSRCTRGGREYVGVDVVDVTAAGRESDDTKWWWDQSLAKESVDRCERLLQTFEDAKGYADKKSSNA